MPHSGTTNSEVFEEKIFKSGVSICAPVLFGYFSLEILSDLALILFDKDRDKVKMRICVIQVFNCCSTFKTTLPEYEKL